MFSNFLDLFILFLGPTNVSVQIAMIALGPISEKEQVAITTLKCAFRSHE